MLKRHDDAAVKALKIVAAISTTSSRPLWTADNEVLVDALATDIRKQAGEKAAADERLTHLETQTRVLAEAVLAIAATPAATTVAVAPAVKAVKDEM